MDKIDRLLLAFSALIIIGGSTSLVQYYGAPYGGPPMWDRRYDPREEERRWPRSPMGPQMEPCIKYGNCRGPRYEDDPEESWRRPRHPRSQYEEWSLNI